MIYSIHSKKWEKILLITAHPDDETMFFSPLLFHCKIYILILSNGNYENKGKAREQEMSKFCNNNQIKYHILGFKDNEDWDIIELILEILVKIYTQKFKTIVTFGPGGVSGHKNHISCYKATKYIENNLKKIIKNYEKIKKKLNNEKKLLEILEKLIKLKIIFKYLKTWSILQKYFFIFDQCDFSLPILSFYGFKNMMIFKTQMVWFRYLYCLVSNYMNSIKFF